VNERGGSGGCKIDSGGGGYDPSSGIDAGNQAGKYRGRKCSHGTALQSQLAAGMRESLLFTLGGGSGGGGGKEQGTSL